MQPFIPQGKNPHQAPDELVIPLLSLTGREFSLLLLLFFQDGSLATEQFSFPRGLL